MTPTNILRLPPSPISQEREEQRASKELVDQVGFSVQNILDEHGKIDFNMLLRFFEENNPLLGGFFAEKEHVEKILFPFFDFLKSTFFSENKTISQNIIHIFKDNLPIREGVVSYIEQRNSQIISSQYIEQYDVISFHLFLLGMHQYFNLVKDVQIDHFNTINALFTDSTSKVFRSLGVMDVWSRKDLSEIVVNELYYCIGLGETLNKLALIYGVNPEERQISFEIGMIIRNNIESLLRQLDPNFVKEDIIGKKLRYLSGRVQCNFAHGSVINGADIRQIEEQANHIKDEQQAGFDLQKASDFGGDPKEEESSRIVLMGNNAITDLIAIARIETLHDSVPLNFINKKGTLLKNLIDIYNYGGKCEFHTTEEVINDFICEGGIKNEYQIEVIYYIVLFDSTVKNESLTRLMEFSLGSGSKEINNFFYEEFIIKIIARIIRRFNKPEECSQFLPVIEKIYSYITEKNISQSVLSYSRVYLSLALYYIAYRTKEYTENAKNCFFHYKNLSKSSTYANQKNQNSQDEKDFFIALGYITEIERYNVQIHYKENLEMGGMFEFDEYTKHHQQMELLSIETEAEKIIASMNMGDDILSQNQINEIFGTKIAGVIFYNLCTTTIIGDCQNCSIDQNNKACEASKKFPDTRIETCPLIPTRHGFLKKRIFLDGEMSIVFTYPTISEEIFEKIFFQQQNLIKERFGNLIAINHKNILLQNSQKQYEKLAFYDTLTGLPNKNSLLDDLKKLDNIKPFLLLLKFDQVTDISDGFGFDRGDIFIKKIAEMLVSLNIGIIYRTGGSEFGIITTHNIENKEAAIEDYARKLINRIIKRHILLPGNELFHVTPTIGIVQSDGTRMYDKAHAALQGARRVGLGEFKLYEEGITETKIQRELLIKSELSIALKTEQVVAHYQWIRDNKNPNNPIRKHEALMRVPGFSPGEFIEVAKKHGLLPELTKKVIKDVLQAAQGNNDQFSINVTEENLRDPDFIGDFKKGLEIYNIPATRICIEVTEDVIKIDTEYMKKLEILDQMGCEFSIDDFGARNSGWDRLIQLKEQLKNFRYLKIDGLFIKDIDTNLDHYAIAEGTTRIAHNLGLKVVAEFVETLSIQKKIEELGIDYSQGHLYSKAAAKIIR